jgi:hypothetical protein
LDIMRRGYVSPAAGLVLVFLPAVLQAQGKIQGEVVNGSSGRPLANQSVQLLLPRGGMQRVATATTDASGRFAFPDAQLDPSSFYLVQAEYPGVDYNAPAPFDGAGRARVSITVYEASRTAHALSLQSARVVVRAGGNTAHVQDMFAVRNAGNPPRSYANPDGTFHFRLGPAAAQPSAAVAGLMNMLLPEPLKAGRDSGEYSLQYPLKPGLTVVVITYDVDYGSNRLALGDSAPYPIASAELLVSPPGLAVDSSLFKPAGSDADTGSRKYVASGLESGTCLWHLLSLPA